MIKFFRNLPAVKARIRQKLIEQKKVQNYFLYAISEIIMIVIFKNCPVKDNILVK